MFEKSLGMTLCETRYDGRCMPTNPSALYRTPLCGGKTRNKEPNRLTDAIHPRCPAAHTTAADSEEATPREPRPGPSR